MELERKFMQFGEGLEVSEGSVIAGYASLFDVADQGGDQVAAGAYAASLARLEAEGRSVKMLWQHDPVRPIGVWDEVKEDERGLYVKGRLLSDVAQAREAMALVEAGAIDGLSIGYRTKQATKEGAGRRLVEVDLWEVSLVTFPMLPEARVAAKGDALADGELREMTAALEAARQEMAG